MWLLVASVEMIIASVLRRHGGLVGRCCCRTRDGTKAFRAVDVGEEQGMGGGLFPGLQPVRRGFAKWQMRLRGVHSVGVGIRCVLDGRLQ